MISIIFFVVLVIMLLLGIPVAISLGLVASAWIIEAGRSTQMIASRMYASIDSFTIMALPFFLLAGQIMNHSGITDRIIKFVNIVVGGFRGGLAQANIYTSLLFAGITGAAISDVSALGTVFVPSMEKQGYTRSFAAMITAASSIVGPIIPPSIIVVIYGAVTGTSIGALFAAAIIPGILIGLAMSLLVFLISKKREFPIIKQSYKPKELLLTFKDTLLAILMPVIILGGILGGVFTPTEAAAVAVLYALIVGVLIYRTMSWHNLLQSMTDTINNSAALFFIFGLAGILGWIIARVRLPAMMAEFFMSLSENPSVILLLVIVLLLFVGTWLETGASCILLAPILAPMMELIGVHPLHFGIIMIVTLNVGLITPPLGVCIFAASRVGNVKFEDITREIWPFLLVDLLVILLLVFIPQITLMLPRLMGFIN